MGLFDSFIDLCEDMDAHIKRYDASQQKKKDVIKRINEAEKRLGSRDAARNLVVADIRAEAIYKMQHETDELKKLKMQERISKHVYDMEDL